MEWVFCLKEDSGFCPFFASRLLDFCVFEKKKVGKKDLRTVFGQRSDFREEDVMSLRNHFGPAVLRSLSSANLESLAGGQLKNEIREMFKSHTAEKWYDPSACPTLTSWFLMDEKVKNIVPKKLAQKSKL